MALSDFFLITHEHVDDDMYWLGRVPCRTVRLVGMVVGIDNLDDMTRLKGTFYMVLSARGVLIASPFSVDDGTEVVDCDCKHPKAPKAPLTPKSKRHKASSSKNPSKSTNSPTTSNSIPAKYRMPENLKVRPPDKKEETSPFSARPAFPHVDVGMVVRVIGRVTNGRGSRFLRVEPGNFGKFHS